MTFDEIVQKLGLEAHPMEGGYFRETYRSSLIIPSHALPDEYGHDKSVCTAIYFLIGPNHYSAMHRVKTDEIFHFYSGDPVEMLQLHTDGTHSIITIGSDIMTGESPQVVVPAGTWQGSRLKPGGKYALMGTTVAPAFDYDDYEHGSREALIAEYPECEEMIKKLTKE
ncbi:cupin domain-containing protein [bacterium]|nr:cupin domain-containing protein [bacterium]